MDKDEVKVVVSFIGIIIMAVILLIFGVNALAKAQCLASYSNYQPQYTILSGCRVMWNGVLTPTDIVREMK